MPRRTVHGIELNVVERGSGEQTIVFSHSYLVDPRHFEAQIAALEGRHRIVAYDQRDHGESARVAVRLAIHHRELLRSLVLMDTSGEEESLLKRMKYIERAS